MGTTLRLSLPDTASLLANPRPIVVALYFKSEDAPRLWDLASRHEAYEGDVSMLAKAARATERGLPIVVECTVRQQLEEVKSFFPRYGIEAPRIEELRV
jgi:hypothetical protein